jgi:predicted class III extradiol MEMO1 family dioxygenase
VNEDYDGYVGDIECDCEVCKAWDELFDDVFDDEDEETEESEHAEERIQ